MSDWKVAAEALARTSGMSWRKIAEELGVPKSSVSDYLRKVMNKQTSDDREFEGPKILFYDIETSTTKSPPMVYVATWCGLEPD